MRLRSKNVLIVPSNRFCRGLKLFDLGQMNLFALYVVLQSTWAGNDDRVINESFVSAPFWVARRGDPATARALTASTALTCHSQSGVRNAAAVWQACRRLLSRRDHVVEHLTNTACPHFAGRRRPGPQELNFVFDLPAQIRCCGY